MATEEKAKGDFDNASDLVNSIRSNDVPGVIDVLARYPAPERMRVLFWVVDKTTPFEVALEEYQKGPGTCEILQWFLQNSEAWNFRTLQIFSVALKGKTTEFASWLLRTQKFENEHLKHIMRLALAGRDMVLEKAECYEGGIDLASKLTTGKRKVPFSEEKE